MYGFVSTIVALISPFVYIPWWEKIYWIAPFYWESYIFDNFQERLDIDPVVEELVFVFLVPALLGGILGYALRLLVRITLRR
ncbi:MAG: hypothetical protein QME76_09865 [Bacillota bacterium]|nr:hypothetical protein [Bacillota bacterium]